VRCLLIAPSNLDLSSLTTVLAEEETEVELTSDIGAGVALQQVDLDQFDCCIALVEAGHRGSVGSDSALVEIGIVVARGLPLIVVAQERGTPSPALAGLPTVSTSLGNVEALRLHLRLFLRSVARGSLAPQFTFSRSASSDRVPADRFAPPYRAELAKARAYAIRGRALAFERLVMDIVRQAGGKVEQRQRGWRDAGVDFAAFLPGEEKRLGPLLFQVKSGTVTAPNLASAQRQLSEQVLRTRSGLGLLIYDLAEVGARKVPPAPLVSRFSIDQLVAELEFRPLTDLLVQARGRAVHGT
jgi:hypothetical protein